MCMSDHEGFLSERIESFIRTVDEAHTLPLIFDVLATHLTAIGFERFAYWLLWPPNGSRKPLCITNYPNDWSEYYLDENYGSHDFVARHSAKSTIPFIWSDLAKSYKLTNQQKLIFDEGADAGLEAGGTVPIHGPGNAKATFSVANNMDKEEFSKHFLRYRHEIHLMATYVHEKIMGLGLHKPLDSAIKLTPRETEILTWIAKGKSRWEVGIILSISEDTVKAHLENIRQKLGASNTTHAIAIALLHGLLLP